MMYAIAVLTPMAQPSRPATTSMKGISTTYSARRNAMAPTDFMRQVLHGLCAGRLSLDAEEGHERRDDADDARAQGEQR
jgi:hypothetical protein